MASDLEGRILAAADRVSESTAERDRLIREASAEGLSLRRIARAAKLSHTAVAKIVRRG